MIFRPLDMLLLVLFLKVTACKKCIYIKEDKCLEEKYPQIDIVEAGKVLSFWGKFTKMLRNVEILGNLCHSLSTPSLCSASDVQGVGKQCVR